MTFLNMSMLYGLAAILIPVAIHYLNKSKVIWVRWAAMRFIQESILKNQKKLKFEDLVLLLLRCLLVLLLVLAFARPAFPAWAVKSGGVNIGNSPVNAIIVIDNSLSMGASNGMQTRFEQAHDKANQILDGLAPGSECGLFFVSNKVDKVIPQPTRDLGLVRRSLQNAMLSDRSSDLLVGLEAAVGSLHQSSNNLPKEIFLITDNQELAWKQKDQIFSLRDSNKKDIAFRLFSVGEPGQNLSVSDIRLDGTAPAVKQPVRCQIEVSNSGTIPADKIRVNLAVDHQAPSDETTIDHIDPGQSETVNLFARFDEPGFHTITGAIPSDHLPADNQRSMALQALDQLKALVVQGNPTAPMSDRDGFFLVNALMPVRPDKRDSYYLKAQDGSVADLEKEDLSDNDVIFLANIPRLTPTAVANLKTFVEKGGGLVVFPGPDTDLSYYNSDSTFHALLPATLGELIKVSPEVKFVALQSQKLSHPVTALWNDPQQGNLATVRMIQYYPLTLPPDTSAKSKDSSDKSPSSEEGTLVVANLADGSPAIVEHRVGRGRVVLFNSTATTQWSNLPIHPCFVPLLHRLVGYLTRHGDESLQLLPGQEFVHAVSADLVGKDFSVLRPGVGEEKLSAGKIELDGSQGMIHFGDTEKAGPYYVYLGADTTPLAAFAVQVDPQESDLRPVTPDVISSFQDSEKDGSSSSKSSEDFHPAGSGTVQEFWWPVFIIAMIAAFVEMVLAHRYSVSK